METGNFIVGVVISAMGIVGIIFNVLQYQEKGAVLSAVYFAADKEEQKKIRANKKAYRYTANILLYLTVICLFFGIAFLFNLSSFAYIGACLGACAVLSAVVFVVSKL